VNFDTGERRMTDAGRYYGQLQKTHSMEVDGEQIEKWARDF
jgi:hypothetical protein